jgi:hypothetical protein
MKEYRPRLNQTEWDYVQRLRASVNPITQKKVPDHFGNIPKILLLDIETLFGVARIWHTGKQRISHQQIVQNSCILSWCGKWLYDADMMSDILTPGEAVARDDRRILESVWKALDIADVVVGHNVRRFDVRTLNARFFYHKMNPPLPYRTVDTLTESQKNFKLFSYKLDYLSKLINNQGKLETDYELWIKCSEGDPESLDHMLAYNQGDVLLLEEAYVQLLPWISGHPNLFILGESTERCCKNCGGTGFEGAKPYITPAGRFESMRCTKCGTPMRTRENLLDKTDKKNLLVTAVR